MAYYTPFASQPGAYSPDKKDINLARRLKSANPNVGPNQIFSIDGRLFISRQSSGQRRGPSQDSYSANTSFERYFPTTQATPAPTPAPKPAPAPAPAPAPTISKEAEQYRAETLKILQEADDLRNQFLIDQQNAEEARIEREKIAKESAAARSINEARSGRTASLQIQPAGQTPRTAGTQPFKRRLDQFNVSGSYGGLSTISSGMVNL